ncbi:AAA family ATPase [Ascidiaceihabitans sp.]|uniref:AAA family ATPase n=1 Tax=Ascidiaceihabitans sp. TaxID=1872644 RepID=UPI00329A3FE9
MLESITDPEISYEIRSKRTLHGHGELEEYWQRNAERQDQLTVNCHFLGAGPNWSSYCFHSRFYNAIKQEIQTVFGHIVFSFSDEGKICRLVETYTKFVDEPPKDTRTKRQKLNDWLSAKLNNRAVYDLPRRLTFLAVSIAKVILIFIAVAFFVLEFTSWANALSRFSMLDFWSGSAIDVETILARKEELARIAGWVFSASTIIYVILEGISRRLNQRASLRLHKVVDPKADPAKLMARYLSGARRVSIFAGDFDFFEESDDLFDIIRHLETRNELSLFSERTQEDVARETEHLPRTNDLIARLRHSRRIFFESNTKGARATFFEKDGVSQVLHLPNRQTFAVLSGIDENEAVIKMLRGLLAEKVDLIAQASDKDAGALEPEFPLVVLVTGETFSGKSTVSRELARTGFRYVSISEILRDMCEKPNANRSELIDFGKKIVSENDGEALFDRLYSSVAEMGVPVVIDGLRPINMIRRLKVEFGSSLLIAYVTVNQNLQTERYNEQEDEIKKSTSLQKIRTSDTAFGVVGAMELADVVVAGVGDPVRSVRQVEAKWTK